MSLGYRSDANAGERGFISSLGSRGSVGAGWRLFATIMLGRAATLDIIDGPDRI